MLTLDTYLEKIRIRLPNTNFKFMEDFLELMNVLGNIESRVFRLPSSCHAFFPRVELGFQPQRTSILTDFILSDGESLSVAVENSTRLEKPSPFSYQPLSVESVTRRLTSSDIRLVGIDHVGINLPWFASNVHTQIFQLRKKLSLYCLYHRFPTGEPWDFIIPETRTKLPGARLLTIPRSEGRNSNWSRLKMPRSP